MYRARLNDIVLYRVHVKNSYRNPHTVPTVFPGIVLRNTIISPTFFSVNTIWRKILFEGQYYLKFRRLINIVIDFQYCHEICQLITNTISNFVKIFYFLSTLFEGQHYFGGQRNSGEYGTYRTYRT